MKQLTEFGNRGGRVGLAPKSITVARANYAARRWLDARGHAPLPQFPENDRGGRGCSTLDATSNQWIQMVSTRATQKLFDPAARVQRNYRKFQRDTNVAVVGPQPNKSFGLTQKRGDSRHVARVNWPATKGRKKARKDDEFRPVWRKLPFRWIPEIIYLP